MNRIQGFGRGTTRRAVLGLAAALGLGNDVLRDPGAAGSTLFASQGTTRQRANSRSALRQEQGGAMEPTIEHLNPEGMHVNPAFTQAVAVSGNVKTIYIGGQNAVSADGQIVGDTLATQTEQIFKNLEMVLAAAGATLHNIIKFTIYVVQGQDLTPGFAVFQQAWGASAKPPAVSMSFVAGLANPEFLVEIEAIAITGAEVGTG